MSPPYKNRGKAAEARKIKHLAMGVSKHHIAVHRIM